jgi:hypothetical protein
MEMGHLNRRDARTSQLVSSLSHPSIGLVEESHENESSKEPVQPLSLISAIADRVFFSRRLVQMFLLCGLLFKTR